jgi:sterol desaturase/sphingolipid hydroxylase (fatty acid hydroxylase superfamily)
VADYLSHLVRYVVLAGAAFALFYILFRRPAARRKIQAAQARPADIRREVLYSLSSFAVFAAMGVVTLVMYHWGWNRLYFDAGRYGAGYFWFSVAAIILVHDAWFYWTHRLLHWKPLFRIAHRVHHQSHTPTPWAAFSFHPVEAFIQAVMFPLLVIVLPAHPLAAGLWLLYMTAMNVSGHLGYEVLPAGFARHRLFRWHNTTVHHDMHHSHVRCNFGLYYNIWDRLMGTNHAGYEDLYDRVTAPPAEAEPLAGKHETFIGGTHA